jgi:hypothetical protein
MGSTEAPSFEASMILTRACTWAKVTEEERRTRISAKKEKEDILFKI